MYLRKIKKEKRPCELTGRCEPGDRALTFRTGPEVSALGSALRPIRKAGTGCLYTLGHAFGVSSNGKPRRKPVQR